MGWGFLAEKSGLGKYYQLVVISLVEALLSLSEPLRAYQNLLEVFQSLSSEALLDSTSGVNKASREPFKAFPFLPFADPKNLQG